MYVTTFDSNNGTLCHFHDIVTCWPKSNIHI